MTSIRRATPGEKLTFRAADWNTIADAVNDYRDRRSAGGANVQELRIDETIPLANDSGLEVPRYGVCRRVGPSATGIQSVIRPDSPYLSQIVVAAQPIAATAGSPGAGWIYGDRPMRIDDWDNLTDDLFPFLAITQADSFNLRRHGGSWGVPIFAKDPTEPYVWGRLPVVPPPMVRIHLSAAQRAALGLTEDYFDAGFLSFPGACASRLNFHGLELWECGEEGGGPSGCRDCDPPIQEDLYLTLGNLPGLLAPMNGKHTIAGSYFANPCAFYWQSLDGTTLYSIFFHASLSYAWQADLRVREDGVLVASAWCVMPEWQQASEVYKCHPETASYIVRNPEIIPDATCVVSLS